MTKRFARAMVAGLLLASCASDEVTAPPPPPPSPPLIDVGPAATGIAAVEDLTPDQGWTVHIPPFMVPPGSELTDCYFMAFPDLNDGQDIWIDEVKVGQRPGSHHMNIFRVNTIINLSGNPGDVIHDGECKNLSNWADWPLVVNSQSSMENSPPFDWHLPENVAHRFHPGEMLMLQTHYVNFTNQPAPQGGEVKVNFYKAPAGDHVELGTLFARQQQIRICQSNPVVSFTEHCTIPSDVPLHLEAANGHFHSRGTRFQLFTWDGVTPVPEEERLCYESDTWNDPPMKTGMDEPVPQNGGVMFTCDFEWQEPLVGCDEVNAHDPEMANDCCYVFGNTAERAEHCNLFAYYWPKVPDGSIYCDP